MKINKMNASARKFIARRRLSNNGKFAQKMLKNEIIPSIIEEPTLEKNYYFSTSAGGKNVLSTNKTTLTDTQNILTICNTVILSQITPVTRTILNLCDGSVIKALNGSKDINTDPALHCINDQFNAQCKTTSSSSLNAFLEIFLPIIFFAGCCYAIKKCCCTPPSSRNIFKFKPKFKWPTG